MTLPEQVYRGRNEVGVTTATVTRDYVIKGSAWEFPRVTAQTTTTV